MKYERMELELHTLKQKQQAIATTVHLSQENFELNSSRSSNKMNVQLQQDNDYLKMQIQQLNNVINNLKVEIAAYQQKEQDLLKEKSTLTALLAKEKTVFQMTIKEEQQRLKILENENKSLESQIMKLQAEKSIIDEHMGSLLVQQQSPIIGLNQPFANASLVQSNNFHKAKMCLSQHPLNNNNDLPLVIGSNGILSQNTGIAEVTSTELKLYQSCQQMVDAASRMECSRCLQLYATTTFYDHIFKSNGECCSQLEEHKIQQLNKQEEFTLRYDEKFGTVPKMGLNGIISFQQSLDMSKEFGDIATGKFKNSQQIPPQYPQSRQKSKEEQSISLNESQQQQSINSLWNQYNRQRIHNDAHQNEQYRSRQQSNLHLDTQQSQKQSQSSGGNVGGYLLSKHKKVMSFESSQDEIEVNENSYLNQNTSSSHQQETQYPTAYSVACPYQNISNNNVIESYIESDCGDVQQYPQRMLDNTGFVQMQESPTSLLSQDSYHHTKGYYQNENEDLGLEGNKSTYLRPSRNRDMSSLESKRRVNGNSLEPSHGNHQHSSSFNGTRRNLQENKLIPNSLPHTAATNEKLPRDDTKNTQEIIGHLTQSSNQQQKPFTLPKLKIHEAIKLSTQQQAVQETTLYHHPSSCRQLPLRGLTSAGAGIGVALGIENDIEQVPDSEVYQVQPFSLTQRQEALGPFGRAPMTARNKSSNRYNNLLESSISMTTSNNQLGSVDEQDDGIIQEEQESLMIVSKKNIPLQQRESPLDLLEIKRQQQPSQNYILTSSESPLSQSLMSNEDEELKSQNSQQNQMTSIEQNPPPPFNSYHNHNDGFHFSIDQSKQLEHLQQQAANNNQDQSLLEESEVNSSDDDSIVPSDLISPSYYYYSNEQLTGQQQQKIDPQQQFHVISKMKNLDSLCHSDGEESEVENVNTQNRLQEFGLDSQLRDSQLKGNNISRVAIIQHFDRPSSLLNDLRLMVKSELELENVLFNEGYATVDQGQISNRHHFETQALIKPTLMMHQEQKYSAVGNKFATFQYQQNISNGKSSLRNEKIQGIMKAEVNLITSAQVLESDEASDLRHSHQAAPWSTQEQEKEFLGPSIMSHRLNKDVQQFTARESCPSPLNEDELEEDDCSPKHRRPIIVSAQQKEFMLNKHQYQSQGNLHDKVKMPMTYSSSNPSLLHTRSTQNLGDIHNISSSYCKQQESSRPKFIQTLPLSMVANCHSKLRIRSPPVPDQR